MQLGLKNVMICRDRRETNINTHQMVQSLNYCLASTYKRAFIYQKNKLKIQIICVSPLFFYFFGSV